MHNERQSRYTPSSPLSPRLPASGQPISPQPSRPHTSHSRQNSRNMQMNLPRYHPANYQSPNDIPTSPSLQTPSISVHKVTQPARLESPRFMRERQRDLIDRAKLSSRIAASSMGIKPNAPRLDPLGSPKGAVTPLALEDSSDYFLFADMAKGGSPSPRREGFGKDSGDKVKAKMLSKKGSQY